MTQNQGEIKKNTSVNQQNQEGYQGPQYNDVPPPVQPPYQQQQPHHPHHQPHHPQQPLQNPDGSLLELPSSAGTHSVYAKVRPTVFSKFYALICLNIAKQKKQYLRNLCLIILPVALLLIPTITNGILFFKFGMTGQTNKQRLDYRELMARSITHSSSRCCHESPWNLADMLKKRFKNARTNNPDYFECSGSYRDVPAEWYSTYYDSTPKGDDHIGQASTTGYKEGFLGKWALGQGYYSYRSEGMTNKDKCVYAPALIPGNYSSLEDGKKRVFDDNGKYKKCFEEHKDGEWWYYDVVVKECLQPNNVETLVNFKRLNDKENMVKADIFSDKPLRTVNQLVNSITSKFNPKRKIGAIYGVTYAVDGINFMGRIPDTMLLFTFPIAVSFLIPVFISTLIAEKQSGMFELVKMYGVTRYDQMFARFVFDLGLYSLMIIFTLIIGVGVHLNFFWEANPLKHIVLIPTWGVFQVLVAYVVHPLFGSPGKASIGGYLILLVSLVSGSFCCMVIFDGDKFADWWFLIYPPWTFVRCVALILFSYNITGVIPPKESQFWVTWLILFFQTCIVVLLSLEIPQDIAKFAYNKVSALILLMLTKKKEGKNSYQQLGDDDGSSGPSGQTGKSNLRHQSGSHQGMELGSYQENNADSSENLVDSAPVSLIARNEPDEYAQEERHRVKNNFYTNDDCSLIVRGIKKVFRTGLTKLKVAVDDVHFAVPKTGVFGLIGPNGSGKSTLINCLCGFLSPTSGTATIAGFPIRKMTKIRQVIGYCPQQNLNWHSLTVEEHLLFFSRVKGISIFKEKDHVRQIISELGLTDARRRAAAKLSGGMKRRLSLGMALIGNPRILFVDEVSSGLDAGSARAIWDCIHKIKMNRCVVLTTHNLVEIENLADRIAIMNSGQIRCIGDLKQLKEQYGEGYRMTIQVNQENRKAAHRFVKQYVPRADLVQLYSGSMIYQLPQEVSLSQIFSNFGSSRRSMCGIIDFHIQQSSLEAVFLRLTETEEEVATEEIAEITGDYSGQATVEGVTEKWSGYGTGN